MNYSLNLTDVFQLEIVALKCGYDVIIHLVAEWQALF